MVKKMYYLQVPSYFLFYTAFLKSDYLGNKEIRI